MTEREHSKGASTTSPSKALQAASGPADPEPIPNETASGYARRQELVAEARAALAADDSLSSQEPQQPPTGLPQADSGVSFRQEYAPTPAEALRNLATRLATLSDEPA